MRKHLLTTLLLASICFISTAQTISISLVASTNNPCAGTPLTIKYTTSGTFKTGNKFKIQLRPSSSNIWQDFATEESVTGILTTKLPIPNPNNGYYYHYKVVSTDPVVATDFYGITVYDVPDLKVTGIAFNSSTTVNPFESVSLSNNLSSPIFPCDVTFSDSSVVQVNGFYDVKLYPEKSGTYSVSKISNICGVGKATGSVNVTVNNVPLKVVNTPGSYLCNDATYNITYSSPIPFDKSNKFKVRIRKDLQDKDYYDVDATIVENGVVSFKVTDNVPVGIYQGGYQLISSSPMAISPPQQQYIEISAKPSVEVTSASTTINYGQRVPVQLSFVGRGPFNVLMNDGKKIIFDGYYNQSIELYPEKSIQYFVESFSAACNSGVGKNKMVITVKSGIKIDSISDARYCTGTKVKVRVKANYPLNIADKYAVRMKSNSGNNNTIDVNAILIEDGSFLEFIIPADVEDKLGLRTVGLAVLVNGIENIYTTETSTNQQFSNALKIIEKPRAYLSDYFPPTFSKPSVSNLYLNVRGGGSIITELNDASKYVYNELSNFGGYSYPSIEVYTQKTFVYGLKSVLNECGFGTITQNITQKVTITNSQTNLIYLKSGNLTDKSSYCGGEKIKFEVASEGVFDNSNEWKFEILLQSSNAQAVTFLTTKDKSSELTLPDVTNAGVYRIRAYSTNPLVYSNYLYVFIKTKPSAFMNNYTITNGGEKLTGGVNLSGGAPYEVGFSDNTKKIVGKEGSIGAYEDNDQYFEKDNVAVGIFELKSISNACGVGIINPNSTKINILGNKSYNINIIQDSYNNGGFLCYPLNLAFSVNFNIPKAADIPYSVQISPTNDTNFVNLATAQKGNRFSMILPDKYKASGYRIRVVSEDALKIKSNNFIVQTGTDLAETTISLNSSSKITESIIYGGNSALIFFQNLNDNTAYVLKDNFNRFYSGNAYSYSSTLSVSPLKTTTYTIKSASSNCGYSNASGSVKIVVKPTINASLRVSSNTFCPNSDVPVTLSSFGDFEKDNVFKTYIYKSSDTTIIREVATTNVVANYSFKIPSDLSKGGYWLRIKSSNPVSSKDFGFISIAGLPEVTLSGGSIINSGSNAYLTLTPKDVVYEDLEYELSDKATGKAGNNYSNGKYLLTVTPKTTTTYTLTSIKNVCGIGKSSGSAKIEVNPASDKQVNFDAQNFYYSAFCTGSTISVPFTTKGTFTTGNTFTVQMSDAQGTNFKDLKTEGAKSPLIATIPINTPIEGSYLFKVISSDKDATSTTNLSGLSAATGATARFDTASYYFSEGKSVKINVKLTGTSPYYFSVGADEISAKTFSSSKPIYELVLNPTTPTKFKLFGVSDSYCGRGSIIEPSVVSLELITANEILDEMQIKLFPNPTADVIYINSNGKKAELELVDITGMSVLQKQIRTEQEELNISRMKAGTYFLKIYKNDKQVVFKVLKL